MEISDDVAQVRFDAIDVVESSLANLDDMIVFFRSLHMLPDDRQTQVRAERRAYSDMFRGLVEEGMATGAFRTAVSADVIVHYFLSAVNQLGANQAIDLLKGVVVPSIMQAIKGAAPAAAGAPAPPGLPIP